MKLLTESEWPGMVFTMALMIRTEEGFKLFSRVCDRRMNASQLGGASDHDAPGEATLDRNNFKDSDPVDSTGEEEENVDEAIDEEDILGDRVVFETFGEFDVHNQLYILEMMLCFHAWYKCRGPYAIGKKNGLDCIDNAIRVMLESIKNYIPRTVKNGWKLQKFHDIVHITRDMQMFGCPQNWDASPGEHNLIDFAKRPARRTQKRHLSFTEQVAK